MDKDKYNRLTLTIYGYANILNISKDVVRILGYPQYICLLVNKEMNSVAVTPCEADHQMSVLVPEKLFTDDNTTFRICSLGFVRDIIRINNLQEELYIYRGRYLEKNNAVIFDLLDENRISYTSKRITN